MATAPGSGCQCSAPSFPGVVALVVSDEEANDHGGRLDARLRANGWDCFCR